MRIFYYFQDLETNMFNWQRVHLLDELKRHGVYIDTFNPLYYYTPEEANEKALNILRDGNYDLFFTNVCYYKMLFVDTLKEIKRMGIPSLCLRCDNLIIPFNDKILAPYFDLVWLTSIETQYLYLKWGVKTFFAPYAANPFVFKYNQCNLVRNACFVGTPYGSRSIMINKLTNSNIDVDFYFGSSKEAKNDIKITESLIKSDILMQPRWETIFNRLKFKEGRKLLTGLLLNRFIGQNSVIHNDYLHHYRSLSFDDMISTYSNHVLSLASTSTRDTDILANPLKVINLRNFEIPMCGGIEITKYNKEQAEYFEDNKEIVFYHDDDELVDKARYYVERASDNEILKMKMNARAKAKNEHTWWNRFMIAFELLGLSSKI